MAAFRPVRLSLTSAASVAFIARSSRPCLISGGSRGLSLAAQIPVRHGRLLKQMCRLVEPTAVMPQSLIGQQRCWYGTSSSSGRAGSSEIQVRYDHGLAVFSIPLPSRNENCQFTLRPVTNTLADLFDQLQKEDRGADRIAAYNMEGERIASATPIDVLMRSDFQLSINDETRLARVPAATVDSLNDVSEVKNSIVKLYRALNVEQFQIDQERRLLAQLEHLRAEIEPMEKVKKDLEKKAVKRTQYLTWLGLGMMGVQFGLLARLTWWEYSWDIMEPVTYFVGYGTLMATFAYYVLTKQEYTFPEVRDREFLLTMHREARKRRMDLLRYNQLRDAISQTEHDIRRLRDPLQLNLPMQHLSQKPAEDSDPFKPSKQS